MIYINFIFDRLDEEKKNRLVTGNSKLAFVGRTGRVAGKETAVVLGPDFEFHPATSSPAKSNFTTSADNVVVAGVAFVTTAFVLAFAFILAAEDAAAAASKAFWACIC
uniref:Uncharacterized protein n=1 Tax=Glossina palpalis gambiensis TaxID=67801 RepID=A0A1B0B0G9_9MUSC